ncbi:hypothetical protein V1L54_05855 [Streptomyces sp. TRM 70361]|uniref:hypothetical protein n=1 Tax=Streptomyces sp. TRM 70361 TaxID=3116553 RepID=UPI002E7BD2D4|nr:hypothetical protein [Streptomyces sp. TRM 70361]MEE1938942.1 hypothetical protein [Streptomyces sp. TRM 70361]
MRSAMTGGEYRYGAGDEARPRRPPRAHRSGAGPPEDPPAPAPDDTYSATLLGTHWGQTPVPDTRLPAPAPGDPAGGVLRFGPGVPRGGTGAAPAASAWHGAPPPGRPAPGTARRRPWPRRWALAAALLPAVLAYPAWQWLGPELTVEQVAVRADPAGPGCDGTADVVGVVTTNGWSGTIRYRWLRDGGTSSGVLEEKVARGQREARLHLLWTFRGEGVRQASARLEILSPGSRAASADFTYRCP